MEKNYNPKKVEDNIYSFWEKGEYFKPGLSSEKEKLFSSNKDPFCILMPPPNANASLHVGHAVFVTVQDTLTRFNRMLGRPTLWLPGFDHAGFETQVLYEKNLEEKGQSRFQMSREELYQRIWDFTQENKNVAKAQLKSLGASADWSREKFTLDENVVNTVLDTFEKFYQDGLIYRGERIVNWCPHHQTSLSDLEVKHKEVDDKLYFIKYPLKEKQGDTEHIVVATSRPETMLGDTAVAVNTNDKRYKDLVGKKVILPLVNREIPIIADRKIDKEFGTGAVKITPAHDALDFEISKKHQLPSIDIIDKKAEVDFEQGNLQIKGGVFEARKQVINKLQEGNYIQKEKQYRHPIGVCYKCETPIESLVSRQWFVRIKPLAEQAIKVVEENKVNFHPKSFKKIFLNWMKNIEDWNISRQIAWGIRIPVYYCDDCGEIIVSKEDPGECSACGSGKLTEETDVFDTWFSSGQWPFAALDWPQGEDFHIFYPTSVLETGCDILFFWVARMIMLSLYRTNQVPFYDVVLHGLVRDKDRQKMSKSKGNTLNPLQVVEDYGSDALRMALVFGTSTGSDIIVSEEKIKGQRNFANKVWNASRFILMNLEEDFDPNKAETNFTKQDEWILGELKKTEKEITSYIKNYQFYKASEKIYHFFWDNFCDCTIENCKNRLCEEGDNETHKWVLWQVLYRSLKLLHPFMPFITEEIYQKLPSKPKEALIVEDWENE